MHVSQHCSHLPQHALQDNCPSAVRSARVRWHAVGIHGPLGDVLCTNKDSLGGRKAGTPAPHAEYLLNLCACSLARAPSLLFQNHPSRTQILAKIRGRAPSVVFRPMALSAVEMSQSPR